MLLYLLFSVLVIDRIARDVDSIFSPETLISSGEDSRLLLISIQQKTASHEHSSNRDFNTQYRVSQHIWDLFLPKKFPSMYNCPRENLGNTVHETKWHDYKSCFSKISPFVQCRPSP